MYLAVAWVAEHRVHRLSTWKFHLARVTGLGRHSVAALRIKDNWPLGMHAHYKSFPDFAGVL